MKTRTTGSFTIEGKGVMQIRCCVCRKKIGHLVYADKRPNLDPHAAICSKECVTSFCEIDR